MHRFFYLLICFCVSEILFSSVSRASSRGNSFNPDIGLNALMLYQNSNRGNESNLRDRNGASLQEAELQFSADVDPYWRIASTFAIAQKVTVDETASPATRSAEYGIEPEELFAETLSVPGATVRAGKFKAAFGKHNLLHTHAFPFIDAPRAHQVLLGDEGLNDVGISAAGLLPTPWFSEITGQILSGQGDGLEYFQATSANDSVALLQWKNLWDLSDDFTFEFGTSGATGRNAASRTTNLYGFDATFKWRGGRSHALIWTTEFIARDNDQATDERGRGLATWVQYQFSQRWWAQARGEYLELKNQAPSQTGSEFERKQSVLLGFVASEFSALRLQYDRIFASGKDDEQKLMFQLNFSIGAHPAHTY